MPHVHSFGVYRQTVRRRITPLPSEILRRRSASSIFASPTPSLKKYYGCRILPFHLPPLFIPRLFMDVTPFQCSRSSRQRRRRKGPSARRLGRSFLVLTRTKFITGSHVEMILCENNVENRKIGQNSHLFQKCWRSLMHISYCISKIELFWPFSTPLVERAGVPKGQDLFESNIQKMVKISRP